MSGLPRNTSQLYFLAHESLVAASVQAAGEWFEIWLTDNLAIIGVSSSMCMGAIIFPKKDGAEGNEMKKNNFLVYADFAALKAPSISVVG